MESGRRGEGKEGKEGREGEGSLHLEVTDLPARFAEEAARFLGHSVEALPVEQVDL